MEIPKGSKPVANCSCNKTKAGGEAPHPEWPLFLQVDNGRVQDSCPGDYVSHSKWEIQVGDLRGGVGSPSKWMKGEWQGIALTWLPFPGGLFCRERPPPTPRSQTQKITDDRCSHP